MYYMLTPPYLALYRCFIKISHFSEMHGYKAKGCDDSLTARSIGRSSTNLFLMETLSTKVMKEMAALNASVHTCSGEVQLIELPTCNAMHITHAYMCCTCKSISEY